MWLDEDQRAAEFMTSVSGDSRAIGSALNGQRQCKPKGCGICIPSTGCSVVQIDKYGERIKHLNSRNMGVIVQAKCRGGG